MSDTRTRTNFPKLIDGRSAEFLGEPKSPFKHVGEAWLTGWDIPTRYAIDADDQCWADNAHGHPLVKVTPQQFISIFEQEDMKRKFQEILGLSVDDPSWMKQARAHGWLSREEVHDKLFAISAKWPAKASAEELNTYIKELES